MYQVTLFFLPDFRVDQLKMVKGLIVGGNMLKYIH